jgi:hypothetical protein
MDEPGRHELLRLDPRFWEHVRIDPGECPGGIVLHVVNRDGELIRERMLRSPDEAERAAMKDTESAREQSGRLFLYLYDGDSGDCITTLVVALA